MSTKSFITPALLATQLVFAQTPIPALPAAGGTFIDPAYNTRILRVTDAADGAFCGTVYSYWPTFNADSTRLMAACTVHVQTWYEYYAVFYKINPSNLKLSGKTVLSGNYASGIWSGLKPDTMLVLNSALPTGFSELNVASGTLTPIKDIGTMLPGEYIWQWHRSIDDDVFSWTRRSLKDYSQIGYAVWRRSTNTLLLSVANTVFDEVQLDKSGRYLVVKQPFGSAAANQIEGEIIDLSTGKKTSLINCAPGFNLGHSDNGTGIQVGGENCTPSFRIRSLANPEPSTVILTRQWSGTESHFSMLRDNESQVLVSFFGGSDPLSGELVLLTVAGSQTITHICKHYSTWRSYYDSPRANISRKGDLAAFTSNWGNPDGRRDLFVADIRNSHVK